MKKATNSASMRIKNEKIILSLVNRSPLSRADIAKFTGLTKAAVSIIVDDLMRRNILIEGNAVSNSVGRSPVMLHLNNTARYVIGVNITRSNIYVGIADLAGNTISVDDFQISHPSEAIDLIASSAEKQLSAQSIHRSKIYKIAVVTPGPVDKERGKILNPPNFEMWHGCPIVSALGEKLGLDVLLENVSSATALAERYFGSARGGSNFMALLVDDGIGSGIMINDALFNGPCELGHISIKHDGIKCKCGNRGCLERYASIPEILKNTSHKSWREAVSARDDSILQKEAEYLSCAIISANNIFSFDKIILCGDLAEDPQKISEMIFEKVNSNILSKKEIAICAGQVSSKHIVAASVALHDMLM